MAKKPKRRLTEAQKAERKRVSAYNRAIREANKRYKELINQGYINVDLKYADSGEFSPPTPKKITEASIRKAKGYTKDYFYKRLGYIDPETGTVKKGKRKKKKEVKEAEQDYSWVEDIIDVDVLINIEQIINALPDAVWTRGRKRVDLSSLKDNLKSIMWDKFNGYDTQGEQNEYLKYIENKKAELEDVIFKINASDQTEILKSFSRAADILNRGPVSVSRKKEIENADKV